MLPESSKSHFWKPNSLCLLPHQPPPLAPPPLIHIPIIPRAARSSVKSYDTSLHSHSLLLHISKFNRSQRSCSFFHRNVLSISQALYLCLPHLAPVISSALCRSQPYRILSLNDMYFHVTCLLKAFCLSYPVKSNNT